MRSDRFFFQAEDGIRDYKVTGVQTCALPISQDVLNGFGVRPFNWQALATLQHELRPGMALNVGYFRTWFRNFGSGPSATDVIADNLAVMPADFDPFCITAP